MWSSTAPRTLVPIKPVLLCSIRSICLRPISNISIIVYSNNLAKVWLLLLWSYRTTQPNWLKIQTTHPFGLAFWVIKLTFFGWETCMPTSLTYSLRVRLDWHLSYRYSCLLIYRKTCIRNLNVHFGWNLPHNPKRQRTIRRWNNIVCP